MVFEISVCWNPWPLDGDHHPFVLVDAMHIKVRRQGAIRSTRTLIAAPGS